MTPSERRQLARVNHRTPLRFRAVGVAADKTEHFTEALNVSRGGFFFASSVFGKVNESTPSRNSAPPAANSPADAARTPARSASLCIAPRPAQSSR